MGPYIITWWSRVLKLETFKVLYFLKKKRVPKSYQHRFPRPCSVLHTLSRIFLMLKKLKCWIFFCWETKMHLIFLSLGSSRKKNGLDSYLCRPRVNFTSPLVQTANMLWQGVWFNSVSPTKLHPTLTVYTTWGLHSTFVLNALCLCARKISINLLVQKLLVKWWWNWSLVVIVAVVCSSSCLRRTSDSPLFLGSAPSVPAAAAARVVWIAKIFKIHSLKQLSFNIVRRHLYVSVAWRGKNWF